jgi:FixJ family two-component response regulator
MSGAALVARLREDAPHLPAIFMSGYIERPDALPGDAPFIGKPFSRHALLDLVAATLQHRPAVA